MEVAKELRRAFRVKSCRPQPSKIMSVSSVY